MRLCIAFLSTNFLCFLFFIRGFRSLGLWLCCLGNQKLLPDLQFSWVINVVERDQIAVGDSQLPGDSDWVITFLHNVGFS